MTVTPEHRFHSYVTAATVMVMLAVIKFAVPLLQQLETVMVALSSAAALLLSFGVYNSFAGLLMGRLRRWKWVKRWLLGPSLVNGTWVGKFEAEHGSTVYTVEHFEQGLSTLTIRGEAQYPDGTWYARWRSTAVAVDEAAGRLTYVYRCDRATQKSSFDGVCDFSFQRKDSVSAPTEMIGFSADLTDGLRTQNRERRYSEDLLNFDDVFASLRQMKRTPVSAAS